MNQDWTFMGKRGEQEVTGVKVGDLYRIVRERLEYYGHDKYDPYAFCQEICCDVEKAMGIYPNIPEEEQVNISNYLLRQIGWSIWTFGPGPRTNGVADHIEKELGEIKEAETSEERVKEFIDVIILALDGAWRELVYVQNIFPVHASQAIETALDEKFLKNTRRQWPDWRTADPNKAIEHIRGRYD